MFDSFQIRTKTVGDIIIIETDGYINNAAGDEIAECCKKCISEGKTKLLVNLGKSPVINSVGVSIFIEVIEELQIKKGSIGFFNLVPIVRKTFDIMGITKYSAIYNNEEEAVKALK